MNNMDKHLINSYILRNLFLVLNALQLFTLCDLFYFSLLSITNESYLDKKIGVWCTKLKPDIFDQFIYRIATQQQN